MDIVKQYYTTADEPSLAFNFKFISSVQPGATGKAINDAVQDYLGNVPKDFFQNWVVSCLDQQEKCVDSVILWRCLIGDGSIKTLLDRAECTAKAEIRQP